MNKIMINKKECDIQEVAMSFSENTATFRVKGISQANVTTTVPINDLRALLNGDSVFSVYGYFTIYIKDPHTFQSLKQLYDKQETEN